MWLGATYPASEQAQRNAIIIDWFTKHPELANPAGVRQTIAQFPQYNITVAEIGAAFGKTAAESQAWMASEGATTTPAATEQWFEAGSPWVNKNETVQAWAKSQGLKTAADFYRVTAGGARPWDTTQVATAPAAAVANTAANVDKIVAAVITPPPEPVSQSAPASVVTQPAAQVATTQTNVEKIVAAVAPPATQTVAPPINTVVMTPPPVASSPSAPPKVSDIVRDYFTKNPIELTISGVNAYLKRTGYTLQDVANAANISLADAEKWMATPTNANANANPPSSTGSNVIPFPSGDNGAGNSTTTGTTGDTPAAKSNWAVLLPLGIGILSLLK